MWVPRQDLGTGLLIGAAGISVFLLGRGLVIDGTRQIVRRWWGWLYWPVLLASPFSTIQAMRFVRSWDALFPALMSGGRFIIPSMLIRARGRPIVVKRCPWVSEARFLAEELSQLMSVPVSDELGEPLDLDEPDL